MSSQLPILLRPPYPMLARPGKPEQLAGAVAQGYLIEPKLDGVRCLVVISDSGGKTVQLYNRQLVNITRRFPDVVDDVHLKTHGTGHILDGEIYVRGPDGLPEFQRVQHRANRVQNIEAACEEFPAQFVAFDVLHHGSRDIMGWSLDARRGVLYQIAGQLVVATYTQQEADDLWDQQVGEGLMLKHRSARYRPGERDASWLKIKHAREVDAIVGGVTYGVGKRESYFGGLLVGVYKPGDTHGHARLQYIGTVGTGFDDQTLDDLSVRLGRLKTAECPFVARGADWDLAFFVRPAIAIKVRFSDYTRDGIMRHPRFVGLAGSRTLT